MLIEPQSNIMEEANKLVGSGKRHLVMGDPVAAVNVLQEACGMLAKQYGDTADECGEAFLLCGKALLELARMENSVLGNALEGVPEEDEEEEPAKKDTPQNSNIESADNVPEKTRDELRTQVYTAMAEDEREEEGKKEEMTNGHVNGTDSTKEEKEEKGEKGAEGQDGGEEEGEEEGEEGEEDDKEGEDAEDNVGKESDEEDEVGNLQLAWEMLEVAKVIYKRKESPADQLIAAQVHVKLGEVAAESGNYEQAVEDFQEGLSLLVKHQSSDHRLLASIHCQLGLTLGLLEKHGQALEHFNNSMEIINNRLAELQKSIDQTEGPEAASKDKKEMEELTSLLPDLKERAEDAAEALKTASTVAEAMKDVLAGESPFPVTGTQNGSTDATMKVNMIPVKSTNGTTTANGTTTSAASDISHLVRKKRKPEGSPEKESDSKKVKDSAVATNGV